MHMSLDKANMQYTVMVPLHETPRIYREINREPNGIIVSVIQLGVF